MGWDGDRPGVDQLAEQPGDEPEAVAHADLPPALPAEHRRAVEEGDLTHLGLDAGVEPGLGAGDHDRQRIVLRERGDDVDQTLREVDLDRFEHRGEEVGLVGELVVQGTARDTGGLGDALGADLGVAVLGEQLAGRGDEGGAGGGRAVGLGAPGHRHVDIHAVGM